MGIMAVWPMSVCCSMFSVHAEAKFPRMLSKNNDDNRTEKCIVQLWAPAAFQCSLKIFPTERASTLQLILYFGCSSAPYMDFASPHVWLNYRAGCTRCTQWQNTWLSLSLARFSAARSSFLFFHLFKSSTCCGGTVNCCSGFGYLLLPLLSPCHKLRLQFNTFVRSMRIYVRAGCLHECNLYVHVIMRTMRINNCENQEIIPILSDLFFLGFASYNAHLYYIFPLLQLLLRAEELLFGITFRL